MSGFLATYGWQFPFLVYSIALFITVATYFFIFEPARKAQTTLNIVEPTTEKFPTQTVIQICITTLIASALYFVYTFQFSLALDSIGIKDRQQVGNYMAVASIAVPIGAVLFKLVSKINIRIQLAMVAFLIGIGLIGIGLAPTVNLVIASAWIQQLGCGMTMSVLIAWALNSLPFAFRGRGMGFWSSAFFLGQFISPLVVTVMRNLTGSLLNAFVAFGILCLCLAILNLILSRKQSFK